MSAKPEQIIRQLVGATIQRAIRETIACGLVLLAFGAILHFSQPGTPRYYGCLVILVAAGFIAGVVWSFALSYRLLATHPATDTVFWREAFQTQARLLRLVPLWYLAPLCAGILLFAAPVPGDTLPGLLVMGPLAPRRCNSTARRQS
jgi:hypothetical protein